MINWGFKQYFLKNYYFYLKLIFFMFFDRFETSGIKNNFLKKYYFDIFSSKIIL